MKRSRSGAWERTGKKTKAFSIEGLVTIRCILTLDIMKLLFTEKPKKD